MFKELFTESLDDLSESKRDLESLRNTKELRREIQHLKKLMLRQSDNLQLQTLNNIKFLEKRLKNEF